MRLVTWNIQWGRGVDGRVDLGRIVATARALADFDVLCLQEVTDNFSGLEGNDGRDEFAELERLLPGYHRAQAYAVDVLADDGRRRRFGNVLFTRYDILAVRRHALPWPADPATTSMPRVALEATLRSPMGPLRVTTTHLEYYSASQRLAQAARLREIHDEACGRALHPHRGKAGAREEARQTVAALLTGDFNFPPQDAGWNEVQRPLASAGPRYQDAWMHVNGHQPHPPTFCVAERKYGDAPYCCDFVFASETLVPRLRSIEVDAATRASDHQPVALELDDH